MEERHVPLSTVAGRLGVSERTVRRWIKAGKLRAYRPGRDFRIPESAVKEFVEESEIAPKAEASPLQDPLFNGVSEQERRALETFTERCRQYAHQRAAHYERRLAVAESGGLFAGHAGATELRDDAFEEYTQLNEFLTGELADRWLNDPQVPEDVKEAQGRAVARALQPFLDMVGRLGAWEWDLAESVEEKTAATRRLEAVHEHMQKGNVA